jgi:hypothetical protein
MNSRPLAPLPCEDDALEPLTPGHFLISQAIESLPDPSPSISLLHCGHLGQNLVRHFWSRWSNEYLSSLRRLTKRKFPSKNIKVVMTNWSPRNGSWRELNKYMPIVLVATVKTQHGTYRCPVTKLVLCQTKLLFC